MLIFWKYGSYASKKTCTLKKGIPKIQNIAPADMVLGTHFSVMVIENYVMVGF